MLQSSLIFKKKIESDWNTYDIFLKDLWKTLLRMHYNLKDMLKLCFLFTIMCYAQSYFKHLEC